MPALVFQRKASVLLWLMQRLTGEESEWQGMPDPKRGSDISPSKARGHLEDQTGRRKSKNRKLVGKLTQEKEKIRTGS